MLVITRGYFDGPSGGLARLLVGRSEPNRQGWHELFGIRCGFFLTQQKEGNRSYISKGYISKIYLRPELFGFLWEIEVIEISRDIR